MSWKYRRLGSSNALQNVSKPLCTADWSAATLQGSPTDVLRQISIMESHIIPVTAARIRLSVKWINSLAEADADILQTGLAQFGYIAPVGIEDGQGFITFVSKPHKFSDSRLASAGRHIGVISLLSTRLT